jgi:hypothetical protein
MLSQAQNLPNLEQLNLDEVRPQFLITDEKNRFILISIRRKVQLYTDGTVRTCTL